MVKHLSKKPTMLRHLSKEPTKKGYKKSLFTSAFRVTEQNTITQFLSSVFEIKKNKKSFFIKRSSLLFFNNADWSF